MAEQGREEGKPKRQRDKLGVVCVGGFGSNAGEWIQKTFDPRRNMDLEGIVVNTDAAIHERHFGKPTKRQLEWGGRFAPYLLGGEEVTHGHGAGGKPSVGKLAAESKDSQRILTEFIERQSALFIISGLGGGTGTGATPVIAGLAKGTKNKLTGRDIPTTALVSMPAAGEGEPRRLLAAKALKQIQKAGVTTFPIRNDAILEFLSKLPVEERDKITYEDRWRIINENTIQPQFIGLQEVLQEAGDIMNRDLADWATMMDYGRHGFASLVQIDPKVMSAEKELQELLHSPWNDIGVIKQAKGMLFWFHGACPDQKVDAIIEGVREEAVKGGRNARQINLHPGIYQNVRDKKVWVLLVAVSDKLPKAEMADSMNRPTRRPSTMLKPAPTVPEPSTDDDQAELAELERLELEMPAAEKPVPERPPIAVQPKISVFYNGARKEVSVPSELHKRFTRLMVDPRAKRKDMRAVLQEVAVHTGDPTAMPDMPLKFEDRDDEDERVPEPEQPRRSGWGSIRLFSRKGA